MKATEGSEICALQEPSLPYKYETIGLPVILLMQMNWSCLRSRVMLFQQIERLINVDSVIGKMYVILVESLGHIKAQIEMARYLPVRVVNNSNVGINISYESKASKLNQNDQIKQLMTSLTGKYENKLGTELPADEDLSFGN